MEGRSVKPFRVPALLRLAALAALCGCVSGCNTPEEDQRLAGGGIETGNTGSLSGRVLDDQGFALQQAEVAIVDVSLSDGGPAEGTVRADTTDSAGNFRFLDLPKGSYAVFTPCLGETPRAVAATRLRVGEAPLHLPDLVARPTVTLEGRVLPLPGVDARTVTACIPGVHACVHPGVDGAYRFEGAPKGSYEIVFLSGIAAHYLGLRIADSASGIVSIKDAALFDAPDAKRVPYRFYNSTCELSFSLLPEEYAPGREPLWYQGRSFTGATYFLLNDGAQGPVASTEWLSLWKHSKTFDNAALGGLPDFDDPLVGFPLPLRLSAPGFDFSQARPGGSDLVVTDAAGHVLSHEIERWDAQAGKAEIWVRVDTLPGPAAARGLTLHWGRADAAPLSAGSGVFRGEDGFIGAWHLNDRTADRKVLEARGLYDGTLDCLSPGDDASKVRTGEAVVAGGHRLGQVFACVDVSQQSGLEVSSEFSLMLWGKSYHHDATHDQVLASKWGKGKREWALTLLSDETLEIKFGDATGWTLGSLRTVDPVVDPDKWHHYALVFDQGAVRFFVDGAEARTRVQGGAIPDAVNRNGSDFYIGSDTMDKYTNWEGDLDEVEYFSEAKSGAWVKAAALSQKP